MKGRVSPKSKSLPDGDSSCRHSTRFGDRMRWPQLAVQRHPRTSAL